jgi:prepilin-type N-terminal cleavage/methylation domain-containing protein
MIEHPPQSRRRGFSLIEVLLATFILAIGLIMVATIFPVAANWTREATESNVSQAVAQNAYNLIKNRFTRGGPQAGIVYNYFRSLPPAQRTLVQALPGLTIIPISERTYLFGSSSPFPTNNPASCSYYWTALARVSPSQANSPAPTYDLYILVFRKGDPSQIFTVPSGSTEVPNVRDQADLVAPPINFNHLLEPTLLIAQYNPGTYDATIDPPIKGAIPEIGFTGIGATSGTVFRQTVLIDAVTPAQSKAVARPGLVANENVIYPLPADGTTASPLIYIYQTTLTF